MKAGEKCGCPCHSMTGVFVAVFGLSFLLKSLGVISEHVNNIAWPIIIMLGGISKTCSGFCKCCDK